MKILMACPKCAGIPRGCGQCFATGRVPTEEGMAILELLRWQAAAGARPSWEWDKYVNPLSTTTATS